MKVLIYHHNGCSNSRGALALIREAGIEPQVIEYLKTPPTPAVLADLAKRSGLGARGLMREKEPLYKELKLENPKLSEAALLRAMSENPILINRLIVATPRGVVLCRPPEKVKALLSG